MKPTTKPRTPHARCMQAKCTAKAAAAAATAAAAARTSSDAPPDAPSAASIPPAATVAPAASISAHSPAVSVAAYPQQAADGIVCMQPAAGVSQRPEPAVEGTPSSSLTCHCGVDHAKFTYPLSSDPIKSKQWIEFNICSSAGLCESNACSCSTLRGSAKVFKIRN